MLLSIVVPVYNEEENIATFYKAHICLPTILSIYIHRKG